MRTYRFRLVDGNGGVQTNITSSLDGGGETLRRFFVNGGTPLLLTGY